MSQVQYKSAEVDSIKISYREAGSTSKPTIVLLHGHISGSHVFRNLIPLISDSFHIIAPDYPGFGNSDRPEPSAYKYNFDNVANTIDKFLEKIGVTKFYVYIFDYGAPVGMIIACKHPERIQGIFTQSGNAYEDGLSPAFAGLKAWWADPDNKSKWEPVSHMFTPEGIEGVYRSGVEPASLVGYDAANLDIYYISRPGAYEIQRLMLLDYQNVLTKYPEWQAYLRKHKPKVVALWGKHDGFFTPPGAEAFKRDVPNADVSISDGGHFLNESHPQDVAAAIKKLL